jgi:hypothetical protein
MENKNSFRYYFLICCSLLFFQTKTSAQILESWQCGGVDPNNQNGNQTEFVNSCGAPATGSVYNMYYRHQENHKPNAQTADKTVHANFVIWQDDNATVNWLNIPAHIQRLDQISTWVNDFYNWGNTPSDPVTGVTEIPDRKIDNSVDNYIFIPNTNAAYGNTYSAKTLFDNQYPEYINYLNIHIFPKNVYAGAWGFAALSGNWIITSDDPQSEGYNCDGNVLINGDLQSCPISIAYNTNAEYYRDWSFAHHLKHEIAHNLGLSHVSPCQQCNNNPNPALCVPTGETLNISAVDFLSDVFPLNATWCPSSNANLCCCYKSVNGPPCHQLLGDPDNATNDGITNNIMSSNGNQYCSPLQLGRMDRVLSFNQIGLATSGYSETPMEITQNETWDFAMKVYSDILVKSGNTLTIACKVYMPEEGSIIVEPGAKLIIDGGEVTVPGAPAATFWQGINVLGNASLAQNPTTHGVLHIINGGTISHARTAVSNVGWAGNDFAWGTQGGIIEGVNANFINNKRDLQFISYHNPWYGSKEWDYQASFINCTFERNSDYNMEEPSASVSMWDVNGIKFLGCTFDNQPTNYHNSGHGIYALSSQFKSDQRTLANSTDPTTFSGYNYAIKAYNVNRADRFTTIANSTFSNNKHAVYLNNHGNARVVKNTVTVPDLTTPVGAPLYGFYFDESTGYTFAQNTVTGVGSNSAKAGAVFRNGGGNYNEAYKNTFNNLTAGTEAIGNNKGAAFQPGLQFKCNNYGNIDNNTSDLTVWTESGNPNPQGIQANQGSYDPIMPNAADLANNLFSRNQQDVYNEQGAYVFNYYYGLSETRYAPVNAFNIIENLTFLNAPYATVCPNVITSGSGLPGDLNSLRASLSSDDGNMSGKRSLYGQLLNGGNTPELEAQILFAGQHEFQNLYIELMSISPYVDEGQLIDLINNTAFPELALRNVLVANPHSGRNPEVMNALLERQPAVSQQTITDVETGSQTITAKDVLEAEMAGISRSIAHNLSGIQYHYVTDTAYWDTDSLTNLYSSRSEPNMVLQLAELYAQKGQFAQAQNVLTNADQTWWGEADVLAVMDAEQYYNHIASAAQNGEGLHNLSTGVRENLINLQSTTPSSWVWHKINAVLMPYGQNDESYVEPVYFGGSNKTENNQNRPAQAANSFKLYPNPAKDYVEIHWDWFEQGIAGTLALSIYSLDGKLLYQEIEDDYAKNVWLVKTNTLLTGMYLLEIKGADGEVIFTEKLSIVRE